MSTSGKRFAATQIQDARRMLAAIGLSMEGATVMLHPKDFEKLAELLFEDGTSCQDRGFTVAGLMFARYSNVLEHLAKINGRQREALVRIIEEMARRPSWAQSGGER